MLIPYDDEEDSGIDYKGAARENIFGVMEVFCILMLLVLIQLYALIKTQRNVQQKSEFYYVKVK